MGRPERVVDVDIAKRREALTELLDVLWVGFGLLALLILYGPFLLDVEAKVFEKDDGPLRCGVDGLLHLGSDAVREELNGPVVEKSGELF